MTHTDLDRFFAATLETWALLYDTNRAAFHTLLLATTNTMKKGQQ